MVENTQGRIPIPRSVRATALAEKVPDVTKANLRIDIDTVADQMENDLRQLEQITNKDEQRRAFVYGGLMASLIAVIPTAFIYGATPDEPGIAVTSLVTTATAGAIVSSISTSGVQVLVRGYQKSLQTRYEELKGSIWDSLPQRLQTQIHSEESIRESKVNE